MQFNLEKDIAIFDDFFERRPEISKESLKKDLLRYYLPYVEKLVALKKQKSPNDGLVIGVSAIQGTGKTTQGEIMEVLLQFFGFHSVSRSIDDHYLTHKQLCQLRQNDPRYIRRGPTHDIQLAITDLKDLQSMTDNSAILVSGYDKGAQSGDGDRFAWVNLTEPNQKIIGKIIEEELVINKQSQTTKALQLVSVWLDNKAISVPENMGSDIPLHEHFLPTDLIPFLETQTGEITVTLKGDDQILFHSDQGEVTVDKKELPNAWRLITKKPDFIFYDGWMLGARRVEDESVFDSNLPALETEEARAFAKMINQKLSEYEPLWQMVEFLNVLYVVNYKMSLEWRDQAEETLRKKGEGMTHDQIIEFVYYFWRSVHPGIHIKAMAHDTTHTNQVVVINDDHSIKEIITPVEAQQRYP